MKYLSVCSGIEAASVAWEPLGWTPFAFAEIEPFPCAVLAHHYGSNLTGEPLSRNAPPNLGDINDFKGWPDAAIDVLVGGTPCQPFSVAGLRKGLSDPRGNLSLTFLGIADRYRPEWVIWENVPGVLSQDDGRAFGSIIGGLAELGYGWAYRILDAQYVRVDGLGRAVPQRRRRVFVVGCTGGWRRAGAVLFEPESLSGDTPPRRQAGEGIAPTISARPTGGGGLGTDFDCDGGLIARTLLSKENDSHAFDLDTYILSTGDVSHCLNAGGMGRIDYETETMVAHTLRGEGFDAMDDGTGRGTPLVPVVAASLTRGAESSGKGGYAGRRQEDDTNLVAFQSNASFLDGDVEDGCSPTLRTQKSGGGGMPAVAFQPRFARNDRGAPDEIAAPLTAEAGRTGKGDSAQCVQQGWAVRRLTPRECERLQGFPDGYTAVPFRNKPAADGPRYKALGNSMAVNAMRWLGRRIEAVRLLYIHKRPE